MDANLGHQAEVYRADKFPNVMRVLARVSNPARPGAPGCGMVAAWAERLLGNNGRSAWQ